MTKCVLNGALVVGLGGLLLASGCRRAEPAKQAVQASEAAVALSPPKQGAFSSGQYRNIFAERGKPQAEINAKVKQAYAQLFHGEPEQQTVMFGAGKNTFGSLAYIKDIGNGDVRSEGMSYGMMIAVQMDNKADFDALWNWARSYMYHGNPEHPAYGFFSWQMKPDGSVLDEMPAPDGEAYMATALLFASHRWGDGEGIYNYREEALSLLDAMKNRRPITGMVKGKGETTCVALFNPEYKLIRFTPDTGNFEKNGDHTNPSYQLPAFLELWALWAAESDRSFWAEAAQASRDLLNKAAHPKTGLVPDYAGFDGQPIAASWDKNTVRFRYDAWRTIMNWSVDYAWWAKDLREIALTDRLLGFFASHGSTYPNRYQIDGTPTSQSSSSGLIAANAVGALAATQPQAWQFVDALYRQPVPSGQWRYYDGMLHMMALLHLSGNFRIYSPKSEPQAPAAN